MKKALFLSWRVESTSQPGAFPTLPSVAERETERERDMKRKQRERERERGSGKKQLPAGSHRRHLPVIFL